MSAFLPQSQPRRAREAALERAFEAAGGRDVAIGGGARTIQQYLHAGLVDQFEIHVAPVLLGGGERLFENLDGGPAQVRMRRVGLLAGGGALSTPQGGA